MNHILYLRSSLFGHDSDSNHLADEFLEVLKARNPGADGNNKLFSKKLSSNLLLILGATCRTS